MFLEQWIKNAEVGVAKRNQELIEFTANDVCTYHPGIAETSPCGWNASVQNLVTL